VDASPFVFAVSNFDFRSREFTNVRRNFLDLRGIKEIRAALEKNREKFTEARNKRGRKFTLTAF